jgi:hypothetical protein
LAIDFDQRGLVRRRLQLEHVESGSNRLEHLCDTKRVIRAPRHLVGRLEGFKPVLEVYPFTDLSRGGVRRKSPGYRLLELVHGFLESCPHLLQRRPVAWRLQG